MDAGIGEAVLAWKVDDEVDVAVVAVPGDGDDVWASGQPEIVYWSPDRTAQARSSNVPCTPASQAAACARISGNVYIWRTVSSSAHRRRQAGHS